MEKRKLDSYEKKVAEIIYEWVGDNFGAQEMDDPSWNVEDLAHELSKHRWELFRKVEEKNVMEDFRYVGKEVMGEDFTNRQYKMAAQEYMDSDAYHPLDIATVKYFLEREKE